MSDWASLIWSVAGLIGAVSLAIYVFRRPDASIRVRHKDSELQITPSPPVAEKLDQPRLPPATTEPEASPEASTAPPAPTKGEEETRFGRAYRLLTSGQYDEGIALMQEEAREDKDPSTAASTLALGQYLGATKGSEKALGDLRRTATAHPTNCKVQLWLGAALLRSGSPEEADAVFLRAHSVAESDDDRATALIWRAHDPADPARNPDVGHDLLTRSRPLENTSARSRVCARAAKLFLDARPTHRMQAFALYELAVDLTPTDTSLRFDLAHALGEADAEAGALLHYTDLIARDKTNDGAFNNLGVAAERLGLESLAVETYRQAEAQGNTLATANLAWRLINAGFLNEARGALEAVVTKPDAHRNVLASLGGVAARQTAAEQRRDEILEHARRVSSLRRDLGRSMVDGVTLDGQASGTYTDGTAKLEIDVTTKGVVTGELATLFATWKLDGAVVGAGTSLSWATPKDPKNAFMSSLLIAKSGHGVFVRVGDDLHGITYESEHTEDPSALPSFKDWRFVRRGDQPAT